MTDRQVARVRAAGPATTNPSPAALAQARARLERAWAPGAPAPARRRRSRWLGLGVAVGVVGAAGTALAVHSLLDEAARGTGVSCARAADEGLVDQGATRSGDPLFDCALAWRENFGQAPPPLVAYAQPGGDILVLPASAAPPAGASRLAPGFAQDVRVAQLDHEINDVVRGLWAFGACRDAAEGRALVEAQIARLGLAGWRVVTAGPAPDGRATCAFPAMSTSSREVAIVASTPAALGTERAGAVMRAAIGLSRDLAARLIAGPAAACLSGAQATRVAERLRAGLPAEVVGAASVHANWTPASVPDGTHTCVRPAVVVGGEIAIHLDAVPRASFER